MNKPIYCVIHNNKIEGTVTAIGITKEMLMAKSVIMDHSRMNYKEMKFRWEDSVIYVSMDGNIKYLIQIVSDFDKYINHTGE
jgi:hypothetical protein